MRALTTVPGKAGSAELTDVPGPPASDGPVLVRTGDELVAVDADGTVLAGLDGPVQRVRGDLARFRGEPGCHPVPSAFELRIYPPGQRSATYAAFDLPACSYAGPAPAGRLPASGCRS